eukprot:gnl/TRDRNA2_/TRDRNA2_138794_c3_seq1.p1 gnl/TRDRNA2_/TRDRNA2_138794_c3~~gnl/TRDRNA2_/TRDRNA2_138794_c3_seq1.p1  ORF type:complete len:429 (-),score=67.00 gnl/TRDRNA2_/TRDRNA2_138794_c3_seq1:134-1336(-)
MARVRPKSAHPRPRSAHPSPSNSKSAPRSASHGHPLSGQMMPRPPARPPSAGRYCAPTPNRPQDLSWERKRPQSESPTFGSDASEASQVPVVKSFRAETIKNWFLSVLNAGNAKGRLLPGQQSRGLDEYGGGYITRREFVFVMYKNQKLLDFLCAEWLDKNQEDMYEHTEESEMQRQRVHQKFAKFERHAKNIVLVKRAMERLDRILADMHQDEDHRKRHGISDTWHQRRNASKGSLGMGGSFGMGDIVDPGWEEFMMQNPEYFAVDTTAVTAASNLMDKTAQNTDVIALPHILQYYREAGMLFEYRTRSSIFTDTREVFARKYLKNVQAMAAEAGGSWMNEPVMEEESEEMEPDNVEDIQDEEDDEDEDFGQPALRNQVKVYAGRGLGKKTIMHIPRAI